VAMVGDDAHDTSAEHAINTIAADVARALPVKPPRFDFITVVPFRNIDPYDIRASRIIDQFAVLAKPASTNTYSSLQRLIYRAHRSNHDGFLISLGRICLQCSKL